MSIQFSRIGRRVHVGPAGRDAEPIATRGRGPASTPGRTRSAARTRARGPGRGSSSRASGRSARACPSNRLPSSVHSSKRAACEYFQYEPRLESTNLKYSSPASGTTIGGLPARWITWRASISRAPVRLPLISSGPLPTLMMWLVAYSRTRPAAERPTNNPSGGAMIRSGHSARLVEACTGWCQEPGPARSRERRRRGRAPDRAGSATSWARNLAAGTARRRSQR